MALNDTIPKSVAFIVSERGQPGNRRTVPIGTTFFVGVRTPPEPASARAFTTYLVTAAHVVRNEERTVVRLRRLNGPLEDVEVGQWYFHDTDDVAVCPVELDEADNPFDIALLPIPDFLPSGAEGRHLQFKLKFGSPKIERVPSNRPMLGDTVFFAGLFAPIPTMGEQNVPLVRSGTLAAVAQPHVPVKVAPGTVYEYTAHLIDCRSYAGFSGSPCFIQFPRQAGTGGVGRPDEETELLGLICSHFDQRESMDLTGEVVDLGTVQVPIHSGVAVVTPAEAIEELLSREDVVADRGRREAAYVAEEAVSAANPSSTNTDGDRVVEQEG